MTAEYHSSSRRAYGPERSITLQISMQDAPLARAQIEPMSFGAEPQILCIFSLEWAVLRQQQAVYGLPVGFSSSQYFRCQAEHTAGIAFLARGSVRDELQNIGYGVAGDATGERRRIEQNSIAHGEA